MRRSQLVPPSLGKGILGFVRAAPVTFTGKLVAEGDSLTEGYPSETPYTTYFSALNSGATVVNVSIGGTSILNMMDRATANVDAIRVAGAVLVFWGGTNDLSEGRSGATVYSDYASYCTSRRSAGWTKIIGINCIARGDINNTQRLALNSALLSGHSFLDALIDAATFVEDWTTIPSYWQGDHIHLLSAAYSALATTLISPAVRALA